MTTPTVLALDTSTHRGGVAVARLEEAGQAGEGVSVLSARDYQGTTDHAERLLFEIDAALAEARVTLADLTGLAVCVGPGSFTGVRVGVSTAKALALSTGAPVFAMTSLELMAAALPFAAAAADAAAGAGGQADLTALRAALLDAKRGELFVGAFEASGRAAVEPTHLKASEIVPWLLSLPSPPVVVGEVASALAGLDRFARVRSPLTDLPSAGVLARLAVGPLSAGKGRPGALVEPSYLRPPDAALPAGG